MDLVLRLKGFGLYGMWWHGRRGCLRLVLGERIEKGEGIAREESFRAMGPGGIELKVDVRWGWIRGREGKEGRRGREWVGKRHRGRDVGGGPRL